MNIKTGLSRGENSMDDLINRISILLEKMRKDGVTKIEVDFHDLSRMYQMLNMMKRISEIADWCKEGYK